MVAIYCAVVGIAESAFPVIIDPNESLGELKRAIKAEIPSIVSCDAPQMALYLAKKINRWVTERDAKCLSDRDMSAYRRLEFARAPLRAVGLSEKDMKVDVADHLLATGLGPIHVLIVLPNAESEVKSTDPFALSVHPHFEYTLPSDSLFLSPSLNVSPLFTPRERNETTEMLMKGLLHKRPRRDLQQT